MSNEINFGWASGRTLTYGAYEPDGSVRTAAGTSLPEIGSTGYYVADNGDIEAGDWVIVKESITVVGAGEYSPEVSISGDLVTIEADLTEILEMITEKIVYVFDDRITKIDETIVKT